MEIKLRGDTGHFVMAVLACNGLFAAGARLTLRVPHGIARLVSQQAGLQSLKNPPAQPTPLQDSSHHHVSGE